MPKLLLVEDDIEFATNLIAVLVSARYVVEHVTSAEDAFRFLSAFKFDLVILDWELPGKDGPASCKKLKEYYADLPVIMLTGRGGVANAVFGLDAGADDYVPKPCNTDELIARIRVLMRRSAEPEELVIECGRIVLAVDSHSCRISDVELALSKREYELLRFFLMHPDQDFTAEALFLRIWPDKNEVSKDLVRMYVKRLRDKVGEHLDSSPIITSGSGGYRFSSKNCD